MFQFTGLTSDIIGYSIARVGCPIRIFTDQRLFAPPRNFSQLITSFIVSESQGIPRTPLLTFFYYYTYRLILTSIYFSQYVKELYPNLPFNDLLFTIKRKRITWIFMESNHNRMRHRISFHSSILRTSFVLLFF